MPSVARWRRLLGQQAVYAFRYRPGDSLAALGITATRADATNCARYRDQNGLWQIANANVLRDNHWQYDTLLGRAVRTLLREGAGTNSALGACSFADGTYWNGAASFTLAAATSCIAGQTATKHTDAAGGQPRLSVANIGTFVNGQTDCISVLIENDATVPATASTIRIYDVTAAAYAAIATLTWGTKSSAVTTGSGTTGVIDLGTGPNGGNLLWVWLTFTGIAAGTGGNGNNRRLGFSPTAQANKATIVHHAQFEAASSSPSSPIVTGAGAVTRAADLISLPWSRNPEAGTWYVDAYDLGAAAANNARTLEISNTASDNPRWLLYTAVSKYTTYTHNGTAAVTAAVATSPTFGQRIEMRPILASDGSVKIGDSINSAAEIVTAASAANALNTAWAAPTRLYIGCNGTGSGSGVASGNLAIRSLCYVPGPETSQANCRAAVLN